MDKKRETLVRIREERKIFEKDFKTFVKKVGIEKKYHQIYRIKENDEKEEELVNELWSRIKEVYNITDEKLFQISSIYEEYKRIQNLSDKVLYEKISELKQNQPNLYWKVRALMYIKHNDINIYDKNSHQKMKTALRKLNDCLFSEYPEKTMAYNSIITTINMEIPSVYPNTWSLICYVALIFECYDDISSAANVRINFFRLMGWGEHSYWHEPNKENKQGEKVWLLVEVSNNSLKHGEYFALKLMRGANAHVFSLDGDVQIWQFLSDKNVLQVIGHGKYLSYEYSYNEDKRQLEFDISEEDNFFGFPSILQKVDLLMRNGKYKDAWANTIDSWDKSDDCENTIKKALNTVLHMLNIDEILEGRLIEDVILTYTHVILVVKENDDLHGYHIPSDAYDFLKKLTIEQSPFITRHKDGKEYVEWWELGYSVQLSEFEQLNFDRTLRSIIEE